MNNPFDFSRGMYESWEKAMAEAMEKLTQDEAFVKNLTKAFTGTLDVRTQISSQLEKYLKSINMPTRTDLERLLGYLRERPRTLDELVARRLLYPPGFELPYVECAERRSIGQHLDELQAMGAVQMQADGRFCPAA